MTGDAKKPKLCLCCGRAFEWRKKWDRDWEAVKFCSKKCRKDFDPEKIRIFQKAILQKLSLTPSSSTICPSEVTRSLFESETEWRKAMEPVRQAARLLVHEGKIEITQKGKPVDPSEFKGPIRLKLK